MTSRPDPRKVVAIGVVVAAHGALYGLLGSEHPPPRVRVAPVHLTTVVAPRQPTPVRTTPPERGVKRAAVKPPAVRARRGGDIKPDAPNTPLQAARPLPPGSSATDAATHDRLPVSPAVPPGMTLDLTLPASTLHAIRSTNPAVAAGPRTPRKSFEDTVAQALKPAAATTIEELGDGRVRVRRGVSCYEVERTQLSRVDPFSQAPPLQARSCAG